MREPRHQPLDQGRARLRGGGAHAFNVAGRGRSATPDPFGFRKSLQRGAGASASLRRGRATEAAHRRAHRPRHRRARRGADDDADARRHLRARRPVHAARPGRDPHRPRPASDRPLRAPADALERDDPGRRARHFDAEAPLVERDDGRRQRRLLRRLRPAERRPDARQRRRQPALRRPLQHGRHSRRRARRPPDRVLRHLARPRPAPDAERPQPVARRRTGSRSSRARTAPPRRSSRVSPRPSSSPSRRRRRTPTSSGPWSRSPARGGTPIPQGGAVLVARGTAAARLAEEAVVGTNVTLRLIFRPEWTGVTNAVGGGPVLVRSGGPVFRAQEAFTSEPACAAQPAHRRGPARRRAGADGRHRRPPAGLQRRHDELRARADDGAARRRHRLRLRRRRLVLARLRREAAQPPLRPRRRAPGLERAPAHVLRGLLAHAGSRRSRRTATATPRSSASSRTRSSGPRT